MVRRQRSAEELNWRYRQNPEREHRVVTVRRGGELLAFAVLIVESEGIASLVELFGRDLSVVGMPLLAAITDLCVSQNLWAVYAHCSKGNPFRTVLEAVGFRPRERAARVVAYTKATGPARIHLHGGLQWSLGQTELLG
jgi:CelD/BcsL family acetyltransferase involved in cellulose biosynthesis